MINILMCGILGRLGQTVLECTKKTDGTVMVAGVDAAAPASGLGFPVYSDIKSVKEKADVIIDFSRPAALSSLLSYAKENNIPIVLATTGYTPDDIAAIKECSKSIPVFFSANMSLGVNLQKELIKKAAEVLGNDYDIEIIECHHNVKVDSPSGTALALADCINSVFSNEKEYSFGRTPKSGRREKKEIGIHAVRGGTVVGEHDVMFLGNDEILKVSHSALSKQVFAAGAIRAAQYLVGKPAGFYDMSDIFSEANALTAINKDSDIVLFTVSGVPASSDFPAKLFGEMGNTKINVDIINQNPPLDGKTTISFSVGKTDKEKTENIICNISKDTAGITFTANTSACKISVEGIGMEYQSGVAAKVLSRLAKDNIDILLITTSETKISLCVDKHYAEKTLSAIKDEFGLE